MQKILNKFNNLNLSQYESQVIYSLYSLGQSKATEISEYSGVPKAKIYDVLELLCNKRLIRMHATKPKTYSPLPPKEFFKTLKEWEKEKYNDNIDELKKYELQFQEKLDKLYNKSKTIEPHQELVEIIKLGDPSHFETKKIINNAKKELYFLTESFEYLDIIEKELDEAISRGVNIKVMLASKPNIKKENLEKYDQIIKRLKEKNIEIKFSKEVFNIRYTLSDPEENGSIILVVKEYNIPKELRNAVYSSNSSFVKGLANHFKYFWNS